MNDKSQALNFLFDGKFNFKPFYSYLEGKVNEINFMPFFSSNVFKPLIAHNILQSIDLIADSTKNFAVYCVKGIKANKKKIKEHLDNSLMLVTALAPHIGYDNAAKIAKTALKNNTTLKQETLKTGLISEKDYEKIVDPRKMIYPA